MHYTFSLHLFVHRWHFTNKITQGRFFLAISCFTYNTDIFRNVSYLIDAWTRWQVFFNVLFYFWICKGWLGRYSGKLLFFGNALLLNGKQIMNQNNDDPGHFSKWFWSLMAEVSLFKLSSYACHCTIGSGNGFVLSGNKPLPEPMLTQILATIWLNATMS